MRKESASRPISRVLYHALGVATVIYLACRLPDRSSGLPESRSGPDQPCSLIWPCSRWGLPSQPVTRLLVGSYIKGLKSPHLFTLTGSSRQPTVKNEAVALPAAYHSWRYAFCCTFPILHRSLCSK